jgi:hypothetical protein
LVGELCDDACEHRAWDMSRKVSIVVVKAYAATILVSGLPAYIDDPHPWVVQMGGKPSRAYERSTKGMKTPEPRA